MASINYAAREISVKVVYYGPGLSGKTTNLQVIHRKVPPEYKSDMVSLATETDRTLFFDFLPLDLGKIKGFSTKFQLYTVPGQVYYNATRKLVLRGVDGIVFVADSAPDKMQENVESFQNLEENLAEYGYKRENIPIIIQYNKRDLPNALPVEEIQRIVNKYNLPWTEAVANKGKGVFDSLKLIGKIVIDHLNKKYSKQPSRHSVSTDQMAAAAPSYQQQAPRQQQTFPAAAQPQFSGNPAAAYQKPPQPFVQKPMRPAAQQIPGNRPQQFPPAMPPQQPMRQAPQQFQQMPPRQVPPMQPPVRSNPQQFSMPNQLRQAPVQQPPLRSNPPGQQSHLPPNMNQYNLKNSYSQQPPAYQNVPPQQEETFEVSFEPVQNTGFNTPQQPESGSQDYYNYGNVRFQGGDPNQLPQTPDQNNINMQQPIGNSSFDAPSKTDLDLEIEKYQREIEEKQRRMRAQMPSQPNAVYQQPAVPMEQQQQPSAEDDYDVYNMELPSYPMQGHPPTQRQPAITDDVGDDTMYFTSVDTDHQKRPVRRPVNPRNKPQKGFLSKFFNKDNP